MDSPDSLKLDEQLARVLRAYDQEIGEADADAPTLNVSELPPDLLRMLESETGVSLRGEISSSAEVVESAPASGGGGAAVHRVGRFELRRLLGRGGFGIVFLAFDPKLRREVALKIPRPEMLLSVEARRRLLREAMASASFDHPNLVPVYETGEIGPVCYIATGFCPGQTLARWLDRQAFPVPVRQAARLVAILAEAVQHAHDRGVLHRDLKPNNVILQVVKTEPADQEPPPGSCVLRGERFIPRVVDFGLAKVAEPAVTDTGTRQVVGTPRYMAPEQAQGKHEEIGPTVDVYALGVILYELLAGRTPYDGETDLEVLRQTVEGQAVPPRTYRPKIPRDLEAICLKAMARQPSERYRTAVDLADDLRRYLAALPTIARPLGKRARFLKWMRRNDQAVALAVVTSLALFFLIVGTWSIYLSQRFKDDRDQVLQQQETIRRQDRDRAYAQALRNAYLFWQAGELEEMRFALEEAERAARSANLAPCFAYGYLSGLANGTSGPGRQERPSPVVAASFAPNRPLPLIAYADGTVEREDQRGGSVALQGVAWPAEGLPVGVEFTPHRVACRQLGPKASTLLERSPPQGASFTAFALSTDARRLAVGTDQGALHLWALPDGTPLDHYQAEPQARVRLVCWKGDGEVLAVREHRQMYGLMGSGGVKPLFKPNGRSAQAGQLLACLPGGERLAIAGPGSVIRLCDVTGQGQANLLGHASEVTALAPSPDGRLLVTGSRSGEVKFWDLRTAQELFGLTPHTGPVRVIVFAPDGQRLLSGGASLTGGGEFLIWPAHPKP